MEIRSELCIESNMESEPQQQRRMVKLSSATGEIFEVPEAVALQSRLVTNLMDDVGVAADTPIPLLNVSSDVLRQVLAYCELHVENSNIGRTSNHEDRCSSECPLVDAELGELDMKNLYDLIMAANYMHVETLLQWLYCIVAMMIAKKTFGDIRHIFHFGNDFARGGDGCSIGPNESQMLVSLVESLPIELQFELKIKVGRKFHHGHWSPWRYDENLQMLVVELANLYAAYNMHQQIAIILLLIDIGLVNTLVLQTCHMMSLSPHQSGGARIEWIDQMDMEVFKDLIDGIDMMKIDNLIFDKETI